MTSWKALACGVLGCALVFGCGAPPEATKADKTKKDDGDDHDHGPGPHKGTVIELGDYHGEFTVDHGKKEATVYILDGKRGKKDEPVAAGKLTLSITTPPAFQVEMKAAPQAGDPAGKASRFVAVHDNFGKEQEFAGTVTLVVGDKPYSGDFKEKPEHDHDHDKKK
ncbi:MAG TPA: hypothetical protein VH092_15305 [Urbifossiella sp.]|jgi:hypothetical protein|nr:hypothetical protein [Urbifossiella sp.]